MKEKNRSYLTMALERLETDRRKQSYDDLLHVSEMLTSFGFVRGGVNRRPPEPGTIAFVEGVQNFQRLYSIEPANGGLDAITIEVMKRGRCNLLRFTDVQVDQNLARCCSWPRRTIRYAINEAEGTTDVDGEFQVVEAAAKAWTMKGVVKFERVAADANPDVLVGWRSADPGHASLFLEGGVAHADYPGKCSHFGENPMPLHFNDNLTWGFGSGFDIFTVALHEFGHVLGFKDINDSTSVMYHTFSPGVRGNSISGQDEIDLQGLYQNVQKVP